MDISTCLHLFTWIGLGLALIKSIQFAHFLYVTFIYSADINQFQTENNDGFACITGCTSGIGQGFAEVLAARGWNLVLVSRSKDKLEELKATLSKQYPKLKFLVVVSDAGVADQYAEIDRVVNACNKVPLRLLVNNVGVSTITAPVEENTREELEHILTVNCRYPTLLTHALIPTLKLNATAKRRTCIIDVASQVGFLHVPYCSGYTASKTYNLAWSHAIREELKQHHVEVLALTPSKVVSAMSPETKTSLMVASATQCANAALNSVGLRDHCGYWFHHLINAVFLCLPASIRGPILIKEMQNIRKTQQQRGKSDSSKKSE